MATASIGHLDDLRRKVARAKAMRGMRIITLLIPCLDGWGLAEDGALAAARLAVECGAYPLLEIEDGTRYTLNHTRRPGAVAEYLALQRRYRNLPAAQVAILQAEIDEQWARLLLRTG
jgi:pyruvate ferredoxin oxidoreductase beta subunit/2-oxoisovalerate ferredoxin oxidoreductase beta subunit